MPIQPLNERVLHSPELAAVKAANRSCLDRNGQSPSSRRRKRERRSLRNSMAMFFALAPRVTATRK